ncbi:MAG: pyridine nucleotide-disulfide oxidoreductase [Firmicutes bacterium HGW-Firmicutes-12]|nr:MAG: pyridine nucleotide-disulfide oxidoreductase [Firmicutes bacterium HGW-Firmicutes-12]
MVKKVLIVGAGYAGIEAALTLNKKRKKDEVEITLVDKNEYHTLLTELHETAGNRVSEEAIRIPLGRIFKYTGVKVIKDEIKSFDFENNKLHSKNKEFSYDYLVMAMGSTPNFFGIPGLKENAFTLWSFDDAVRIREHIKNCFILAEHEENEQERKRLLTFVVGGAGFTGVEMIGELALWTKDLAKEHDIKNREIRLIIVDMMSRILSNLSEKNAKKAHKYLKKLGVEILLNTPIKEVNAEGFSTGEQFIDTKTLIWAAGVRSAEEVDEMAMEKLGGPKRLKVDEFCRTKFENVYAVGDIGATMDEQGKPQPAMVENAIQTGRGAAKNILKSIRSQEPEIVTVKMHGTMVSVGNFFAVSDIMGRELPVWLSIIMKFMVNIHYLWEITGFWGVARYLYHELLERRQRKLIIEQHWSTRIQAWWLVPVRLFLGWAWLYEGIKKIGEGWFLSPKLATFFGYATGTDANTAATPLAGAEATEGAVEGAAATVQTLFNLDLGFINIILEKTADMIFRIDFGPVNWFIENIVLANDTTQMVFQIGVVVAEIVLGLALLSGTFTFLAALASIALTANFIMTTGIYEKTWWMIFAAIACMGGAGRAFGVDYYLIPYLNNVWEYLWKNHRFSLIFKRSFDRPE